MSKTKFRVVVAVLVWGMAGILFGGCYNVAALAGDDENVEGDSSGDGDVDSDADTDTDTDTDSDIPLPKLDKVDFLLMLDNSSSIGQEHAILASQLNAFFSSVASSWPASDLRAAMVTSNLGMAWGGNPYDVSDGWPGGWPPAPCNTPMGDEGVFQNDWNGGTGGFAQEVVGMGVNGCGWEQHLQSIALALTREDQLSFLRDDALLVILAVTDEGDCSTQSDQIFASPEVQDSAYWNIACQLNEQYLYTPEHFVQAFNDAKGGIAKSVLFATIAGVPPVSQCQGRGNEIGSCLYHADMALNPVEQVLFNGNLAWFWEYACERFDGEQPLTQAYPSRRVVSTAQGHGDLGYVYSICNENWGPAFSDLSSMISDRLAQ